jgi:signal transduction histidine kinase
MTDASHHKTQKQNDKYSAKPTTSIQELTKLNEELMEARQAAIDLMEDAILSREALLKSEEQLKQLNSSLEQQVAERTSDLVKQHNLLRQAEDLAQAGSWEYNVITKDFLWSDGMYELFGVKKGALINPDIYLDLAIPEDRQIAQRIVDQVRMHHSPFEETIRVKPNDTIRMIKVKGTPFKNDKGEAERVLGVDMNITKAAQSQQKIMDLNQALFTANRELNSVNSELRTFASIAANNFSETLRQLYLNYEMIVAHDAKNLSNSGRANLRRAQAAIQKLKLVTDDLVSFSKLQEMGEKEESVDLNPIFKGITDEFLTLPNRPSVEINCEHLPAISGYPQLLRMLFYHLFDNAVKFRKQDNNHVVKVSCNEVMGGDTNITEAEEDREYFKITFSDSGIGFPATESEKIFEMFYQLHEKGKYKGSGVGLAICKKIMELHNGFITAESDPEAGSSFHCFFPY